MKVYICWSGEISKSLAEIFKEWLPGVIQAVKPYYSPDDITKGSRWNTEISKELEASQVGLICLTKDNLEAPWVMFESGALSKNLDKSHVCPILFGVEPTDLKGPLTAFQASKFEKSDIKKMVRMINNELGKSKLSSSVLDSVFEKWWPDLKKEVDKILSKAPKTKKNGVRSERELLEEILELNRSFSRKYSPSRLEERLAEEINLLRHRRSRRFHPMMLDELIQIVSLESHDPIGLLVVASLLRDDFPWLYEIGIEAYRTAKVGTHKEAKDALLGFQRVVDHTMRGPFMEEFAMSSKENHMMMRELPRFLENVTERYLMTRSPESIKRRK